jgi:ABC-2 type transport system permease protein
MNLEEGKTLLKESENYALLFIPRNLVKQPVLELYSKKESVMSITSYVESKLEKEILDEKLRIKGVDPDIIKTSKTELSILTKVINEDGEEKDSFSTVTMVLGIAGGFLIYIFIFMYGSQVMRGVIEEKTNRIIEVIISSVKPFELMMGKIVGVALVGLTQFLLWVVLTFGIVTVVSAVFMDSPKEIMTMAGGSSIMDKDSAIAAQVEQQSPGMNAFVGQLDKFISSVNWFAILGSFLFYFIGGYLLYASLFAAIGSAVDGEADTQQFMMPVTVPLILGIVMMQTVLENPDGTLAFWFSIIPLTSPIVMMMRVPFGVPISELLLSMFLLVAAFIFFTWLSGKIYRVGILMYGKKVNYKELWKWIRHH